MMRKCNERRLRARASTSTMSPETMYRDLSITTRLVGEPPHRQVAVGALLCARQHAATLRKLLPRAWCGTAITNYDPSDNTEPWGPSGKPHRFASARQTEQLAVHLSSVGAAELCKWQTEDATAAESRKGIPPALQAQLDNGTCTFVSGLRVGGAPIQIALAAGILTIEAAIDSRSLAYNHSDSTVMQIGHATASLVVCTI